MGPGALLPSCASRLLVPAPCRAVGLIFSNRHPRPSNGRQHHQHRTDPEQHQRETTGEVLVGGPAGASIAVSHRGVKQESGCHQGNAENLNGATHLSSLQVRGAHQAHLTTSRARPRQPVGWPAGVGSPPTRWWHSRAARPARRRHRQPREGGRPDHREGDRRKAAQQPMGPATGTGQANPRPGVQLHRLVLASSSPPSGLHGRCCQVSGTGSFRPVASTTPPTRHRQPNIQDPVVDVRSIAFLHSLT
jgi:hypothetical protein